jgi:hypothetical protein
VKMRFFPTGKMTGALTEPFTSIQYHGQKWEEVYLCSSYMPSRCDQGKLHLYIS